MFSCTKRNKYCWKYKNKNVQINQTLTERVRFASRLSSALSCSHGFHRQWQKKCTDRNQNLVTHKRMYCGWVPGDSQHHSVT